MIEIYIYLIGGNFVVQEVDDLPKGKDPFEFAYKRVVQICTNGVTNELEPGMIEYFPPSVIQRCVIIMKDKPKND